MELGERPDRRRRLEHPALLYAGLDGFLAAMVPFVAAGVERGEVVLVAARGDYLPALRARLGTQAAAVRWADTAAWHPSPAARLRAVHDLVTRELAAGAARVRLAGEPAWPPGPPELVREWQRYESAVNAVLAPFPATFLCLYDASGLAPSLLEAAYRTHPTVYQDGQEQPSAAYQPPARLLRDLAPDLPPPPPRAARFPVTGDLASARRFLYREALRAGVPPERAMDLCAAGNEALTNALVHGRGTPTLLAWTEGERFVCQVEDQGDGIADPLAGYRPPATAARGRGLWLARQLVDLLEVAPGAPGAAVRLHVSTGPPGNATPPAPGT